MEEFTNNLPAGYVLDHYSISAVLGTGSFGVTYKAYDNQLHQTVAIKEYLPSDMARRASDSATVQPRQDSAGQFRWGLDRFLQEARTLARFRHPNIVRVTRFLEANGTAYLVMDYVEGESLQEYLKRTGKPVSEEQLKAWFIPILQGLVTVHAAGFLHRDIKPGNIYLRDNGEPVLIDFGAARQAIGEHSKSVTGIFTAGYAPTEQYGTDAKKQGPWTDLYSLGATLYRCITGVTPTDAPTRQSAVMEGDVDPLIPASVKAAGKYSPAFLRLIDELLILPIKERPQIASPVLAALAAGQSLFGSELHDDAATMVSEKPGSTEAETVVVSNSQKEPAPKTPIPPMASPAVDMEEQPKKGVNREALSGMAGLLILGSLIMFIIYAAQNNSSDVKSRDTAASTEIEGDLSSSDAQASNTGQLFLELDPLYATVILPDIKPKYSPGMSLEIGHYRLIVKAPGYLTWEGTFDMGPSGCCSGEIKLERDK